MADTPASRLSGVAGDLARRGFAGAAVRLILEWGGTKRTIPSRSRVPGSPLAEVVGVAAALVLADLHGGTQVDIPSKASLEDTLKADIVRRGAAGETTRDIAVAVKCTERYVRSVLNSGDGSAPGRRRHGRRTAVDERQMDLETFLRTL